MEASPNVSNEAVRVLSSRKAMVRAAMERSRNDSPRLVRLEMTLNSSSGTTMAPMTCDQTAPKRETYAVCPRANTPMRMPATVAMATRVPNPALCVRFSAHRRTNMARVAANAAQSMNGDDGDMVRPLMVGK